MRVIVAGGAGFIGGHVVEALQASGHEVVVLDRRGPSARDITDAGVWLDVLPRADAVSHQAARVGLGVDFADVRDYVRDNDLGTAAMLWAMHRSGWRGRLVLASSMVVYGEGSYRCAEHGTVRPGPRRVADLDRGCFEPTCPRCDGPLIPGLVDEEAPADPRNVYAATKLHQEHLCTAFGREHSMAVTALRYHNVYGPRMPRDTPYAGVAAIFRSQIEAGRRPQVFEDGGQRRDFVHVRDVARANVVALTAPQAYDGALNIASGTPVSLLEMATALCEVVPDGRRLRPEVVGGYRLGDVRHITASTERAAEVLGFRATVGPAEGMLELVTAPMRLT